MTEDEMVGWHHRLNEHEFEQAPGVGNGQGSLACCSPWGGKVSNMTEQLTKLNSTHQHHTVLKLGSISPPTLSFPFSIVLAIQGFSLSV